MYIISIHILNGFPYIRVRVLLEANMSSPQGILSKKESLAFFKPQFEKKTLFQVTVDYSLPRRKFNSEFTREKWWDWKTILSY